MIQFLRRNWQYFALALIILIGLIFRFWDLANVPPGLYPDIAKNGTDAIETLQTNNWKLFYPENNGREGLFIWLVALAFKFFGISIFTLKLPAAIIGTLTILGTYLLTREIFIFSNQSDKGLVFSRFAQESAALLAAGFITTSFWHINFSRVGFRAIMVPLLLSFGLWLTLRALRTKKISGVILSGIIWGLGFYTYIAFRFAVLIPIFLVSVVFLSYLYNNRPNLSFGWFKKMYIKDGWWKFCLLFFVFTATIAPLILYFLKHSGDFVSRATGISVFNTANPFFEAIKSFGIHLKMLFFGGDGNWRHNFAGEAELALPVAILFALGIFYSLYIIWESFRERDFNTINAQLVLAVGLFVMILPAALTVEGIPHALRAIGMMPFVFIYAAFGFLLFVRILFPHHHHRSDVWPFGIAASLIFILILASNQFSHYFKDWAKNPNVQNAFAKNYIELGNYLNKIDDKTDKYLIVNSNGTEVTYPKEIVLSGNTMRLLPMPGQTTLFIQQMHSTPIKNTTYILEENLPLILNLNKNTIFAPLEINENIQAKLQLFYPDGQGFYIDNFWIYDINTSSP